MTSVSDEQAYEEAVFQYRKRYEITCDVYLFVGKSCRFMFQYRKRYEITCDSRSRKDSSAMSRRFNTASGMRSHVTTLEVMRVLVNNSVSIPQAV